METINGADATAKALKELGVKKVFGYTGGTIAPVIESLRKAGIELIINSNEQAAAFSAGGVSRSTEEVGVCIVTSGPSVTNTLTSVIDAKADSIPLLVISGQVPENKLGKDSAFQYCNVVEIFKEATKKAVQINSNNGIEKIIKDNYFYAKSGKAGPIVIDFPVDKQHMEVKYEGNSIEAYQKKYKTEHHLSKEQCKEFYELLKNAKKPMLYLGGGMNNETASTLIKEFQKKFNLPFVNTLHAKGVLNGKDELSLGMLGMFGTAYANKAVQETNLFIVLGAKWDDRVADKVGTFGPNAKIAYIDINPNKVEEIRIERDAEFTFIGDCKTALTDLIEYTKNEDVVINIKEWQDEVKQLKNKWKMQYNKYSPNIQAAEVMEILNSLVNENTIITTGVGNHQMLAAQWIDMPMPKSFLTSGAFGTMGFGLPTAIGAYYANPNKTIINIDGDGSLGMNLGELRTMAEYDIPVKIIVLNNQGDGMVRNLQDNTYGKGKNYGVNRPKMIYYTPVAKALGFELAETVNEREKLEKAINKLFSSKGPALLEIVTDMEEMLYPRIPIGKGYADMVVGPYIGKD